MADVAYADLGEYKAEINETSTANDKRHMRDLLEASRVIDRLCGRDDGEFASVTETRYFDGPGSDGGGTSALEAMAWETWWLTTPATQRLVIDPLLTLTTLKTDEDGDGVFETTWGTDDYILYPLNGSPKLAIRVNPVTGDLSFPSGLRRVEIAGSWGDSANAPRPIQKAVRLLARRYSVRPNTPEGIATGNEDMMALGVVDPDIMTILKSGRYLRLGGFS